MNQNRVLKDPGEEQVKKCIELVGRAMVVRNHIYSEDDITLADELLDYKWNQNVRDFLWVVAGIQRPDEWVPEAVSALVFHYNEEATYESQ